MKRKITIAAAGLLLLVLAGWELLGHHTPSGQAPLVTLNSDNFGNFESEFNAKANQKRIVALLSPT